MAFRVGHKHVLGRRLGWRVRAKFAICVDVSARELVRHILVGTSSRTSQRHDGKSRLPVITAISMFMLPFEHANGDQDRDADDQGDNSNCRQGRECDAFTHGDAKVARRHGWSKFMIQLP